MTTVRLHFFFDKFKGLNICCFRSMIQGHTSNKTSSASSPKITAVACRHPLVICFVCLPMKAVWRFDCGVRKYKNHPILLIVKYLDKGAIVKLFGGDAVRRCQEFYIVNWRIIVMQWWHTKPWDAGARDHRVFRPVEIEGVRRRSIDICQHSFHLNLRLALSSSSSLLICAWSQK